MFPLFVVFVNLAPTVWQHTAECLPYQPDTVAVAGTLARYTFYGPPNFGEDPKHDVKEPGFYLDLRRPICTRPSKSDHPVKQVLRVQLVLDSAGYANLRPFLGKRIALRGTLSAAITGHHHAPLLLEVSRPIVVQYDTLRFSRPGRSNN